MPTYRVTYTPPCIKKDKKGQERIELMGSLYALCWRKAEFEAENDAEASEMAPLMMGQDCVRFNNALWCGEIVQLERVELHLLPKPKFSDIARRLWEPATEFGKKAEPVTE